MPISKTTQRMLMFWAVALCAAANAQRVGAIPASSVDSGVRAAQSQRDDAWNLPSSPPWTNFFKGECKSLLVDRYGETSACIDYKGQVTFRSATVKFWVERVGGALGPLQPKRDVGIPYLNAPTAAYLDEERLTGYVYLARPSATANDQGRPIHWELVRSVAISPDAGSPGTPDGAGGY